MNHCNQRAILKINPFYCNYLRQNHYRGSSHEIMLSKGCGKELVISRCGPGLRDSSSPSDEKVYGGVLKNTTLLWLVPHFPQAPGALVARLDQSGIRPMNGHQDLPLSPWPVLMMVGVPHTRLLCSPRWWSGREKSPPVGSSVLVLRRKGGLLDVVQLLSWW